MFQPLYEGTPAVFMPCFARYVCSALSHQLQSKVEFKVNMMLKWWLEDIRTLQELQACLLTMVMISHIICIENWEELPPEGRGNNHMILSCKLAICMGSLVTRVYRHDVHMVALTQ